MPLRLIILAPRPPIQGPTVQGTFPVPPVSQPEFGNYLRQEMNRFVVDAPKQLHQGATILKTFPVPPISQPELAYYVADVVNRILTGPRAQADQGATRQQTHPIPPVSQPLFNHYLPDENRYLEPLVKRFDGATRLQTFPVLPISQPLFNWYWPDVNLYLWQGPRQQFEGAIRQQTYIFPVVQPYIVTSIQQPELIKRLEPPVVTSAQTYIFALSQPYILPANPQPEVIRQFQGATVQQTYIFPLSQPYIVPAVQHPDPGLRRFDGATTQQTYAFPLLQPYIVTSVQQPDPVKRLEPPPVTTAQTYVFPISQPYIIPYIQQPETIKRFDGAIRQATFIFPVSQPEFRYYIPDANRPGPSPQFQGATSQQTYIFPLSQPLVLAQPATYSEVAKQLTQIVSVQTFPVFQVLQPDFTWYFRNTFAQVFRAVEGPTIQRTDPIPPVSQPELARYSALEMNRYIIGATPQPHQGATVQQTYIFPLSQPYFGMPTTILGVVPQFSGLTPVTAIIRVTGTATSAGPLGNALPSLATGNTGSGSPSGNLV